MWTTSKIFAVAACLLAVFGPLSHCQASYDRAKFDYLKSQVGGQ